MLDSPHGDCDVHNAVPSIAALEPYLDDHWREVSATTQFSGATDNLHCANLTTSLPDDRPSNSLVSTPRAEEPA